MIERITDLPDNVLGFTARGKVTAKDYETVLVPAVEEAIAARHKIRFLYHLGPELSGFEAGALWDDAKVGLKHPTSWERVAIVTDTEWIRVATKVFGFAIPGEVRVFGNAEMPAAREWLSS
jgi:hypothetical protein